MKIKKLICPVSSEKVNENEVRLTASMVILLSGAFVVIPQVVIPVFLSLDFSLRAFTRGKYSPLGLMSKGIGRSAGIPNRPIDKAPKIFAARIGFLFSFLMILILLAGFPAASRITASVLMLFATLECVFNFCAGCWVYTFILLPLVGEKK